VRDVTRSQTIIAVLAGVIFSLVAAHVLVRHQTLSRQEVVQIAEESSLYRKEREELMGRLDALTTEVAACKREFRALHRAQDRTRKVLEQLVP